MSKLFNKALSFYGIKEIKGKIHNQTIVDFFTATTFEATEDESPWCSAFVNFVAKECGYERTESALARSWLNEGYEVFTPMLGDIVILWRGSKDSVWGHVGFFVNMDKDNVYILGGNQNDSVNIMSYDRDRILEVRRLHKT